MYTTAGIWSLGFGPSAEWQLLTAVYYGPQEKTILYRDGQVVASESMFPHTAYKPGKGFLHLGKYSIDDEEYGTVTVDELKLWNRALTEREVKALFESYNNDDLTSGQCFIYFLLTTVDAKKTRHRLKMTRNV